MDSNPFFSVKKKRPKPLFNIIKPVKFYLTTNFSVMISLLVLSCKI